MPRRTLPFDPIAEARKNWENAGWSAAADGMALVTSIMRAHQILLARVEKALGPFGLSFARYEVLMLLCFTRAGQLPLGKIGQRLQVHPASVTNVIDRLERDRLVRRLPHPSDQRTTLAALTPGGRRLADEATAAVNAEVFGQTGLDNSSLRQLFTGLADLRRNAGDFD
jgi:DNA-binding MarR family transcriptional regulator